MAERPMNPAAEQFMRIVREHQPPRPGTLKGDSPITGVRTHPLRPETEAEAKPAAKAAKPATQARRKTPPKK
jgi:hypothetical protein